MNEWLGTNDAYIATDTEMKWLMQEANVRKYFKELDIEHFALFYLTRNPDAVSIKTLQIGRLLLSGTKEGYGELKYAWALLENLNQHLRKLIEHYETKGKEETPDL